MALSTGDFTEPDGELRPDMFPGVDDLEATDGYLDTWLTEAQSKTGKEEAQKAWVYHRAYRQVWLRLTTNPHEVDLDEDGNVRYSESQVAAFKEMADEHEQHFEALTSTEEGPQARTVRSQTRSSTTRWM